MTQRFVTSALVAALALAGCSKKDKGGDKPADPGSGTAVTNTPTPPPPPPPAVDAPAAGSGSGSDTGSGSAAPAAAGAMPTGDPAKLEKLAGILFNVPAGAPADGAWHEGPANADGMRIANFKAADKTIWYSVHLEDCRHKDVQSDAVRAKYCTTEGPGKVKTFSMFSPDDHQRVVKAGSILVTAVAGAKVWDKVKAADLEAFLNTVDLDAIAKL